MSDGLKLPVLPDANEAMDEIDELDESNSMLIVKAKAINILTRQDEQDAADLLQQFGVIVNVITNITERFRKPAYDYYKSVQETQKETVKPYVEAVEIIKRKLAMYKAELRKIESAAMQALRENPSSESAVEALEVASKAAGAKTEGLTYRVTWKADCVDVRALCAAIADGKAPAELVTFNQKKGNELARAFKENQMFEKCGLRFTGTETAVRK